MNKKIFFEYFKTFFLTVLVTILIVLLILASIVFRLGNENNLKLKADDDSLSSEMIEILLVKNKYLLEQHPGDYKINLKLGFLYETQEDYKNAESQYAAAIDKAPYHEFKPYYSQAMLYAKLGKLDDSENLINSVGEKPFKKLIKYKAEVYSKLGDEYYNRADYLNAAIRYQKSLNYYKVLKFKEPQKILRRNIASAYIYLADEKVSEMKVEEAISYLKIAKSIVNVPILTYKLGLLMIQIDPKQACEYFDEVFEKEPSLINYDAYYQLLSLMADDATYDDEPEQAELYRLKIKKIKKYYNENLLQFTDVLVEPISGNITTNRLLRTYRVVAEVSLTNTSKYNINSLFFEVVFSDGDEVIERFYKQIINDKTYLRSGESIPIIDVKTKRIRMNEDFPKEINVKIYASKKQDSYKLLLKEFTVKRIEKSRTVSWLERFCLKYIYPYIGF